MQSNPDHMLIALGIGKPKPNGPPPSVRDRLMGGAPSPPMQDKEVQPGIGGAQPSMGGKASPEEAGVVTDEQHCGECSNWHHDSGECDKVDGSYQSADGCAKYFEALPRGGAQESAEMDAAPPQSEGMPKLS